MHTVLIMWYRPSLCMLLGILSPHLATSSSSKSFYCDRGQYYDHKEGQCKKCSMCPTNQIIKVPCSDYQDQECGPFNFNDFPNFDSRILIPYPNSLADTYDENDYYALDPDNYEGNSDISHGQGQSSVFKETDGPTTVEKEDREYWKTLAFALIGLLSVLIIVATVIVLLACRKLQRATVIKQTGDEGDMGDDADSGYVVIRAIRNIADPRPGIADLSYYTREDFEAHPPLLAPGSADTELQSVLDSATHPHPGRLCFLPKVYKPQRRLLNYDADDVFESDDSSSSYKVPVRNKLHTIAEKSDSSSAKSSDTNNRDANQDKK